VLALLLLLAACASIEGTTAGGTRSEREFARALELMQQQRYQEAVAVLAPLAQQHRDSPGIHVNLALAYQELGDNERAEHALSAALAADPQHAEANNLMAIVQRRAGRFQAAREYYQRLLQAHPEHANGHLNLAILCDIYLADLECARHYYRRYQALSNDQDEEVIAWLADLERRLPGDRK